jgi:hypothetical protein
MDELIRVFSESAQHVDKSIDHQPPDLTSDHAARLVALLVEGLGGSVTVTRKQLRDVSERCLLLVIENEGELRLDTRYLESDG